MILLIEERDCSGGFFGGHCVEDLVVAQKDDIILVGVLQLGDGLDEGDFNELVGELIVLHIDEEDDMTVATGLSDRY